MIRINSSLSKSQQKEVFDIWNQVYPAQLAHADRVSWDRYQQKLANPIHYVWEENNVLGGWMVTFDRENKRYFVLMVAEKFQGKGIGRRLMKYVQARESNLWGLVVDHDEYMRTDGKPYRSPLTFYQRLGFKVNLDERWENEQISAVKIKWKQPSP